jgi:hypothetical protein
VLVHEHHFGLSDDDMEAIEADAAERGCLAVRRRVAYKLDVPLARRPDSLVVKKAPNKGAPSIVSI